MFKTEICEILGIEYPIVLGGMLWVGMADLVAAVSEAGGLGLLGAGGLSSEQIADELGKVKQKTKKPFGVNIPLIRPDSDKLIEASITGGATVITTSSGSPNRFTRMIQDRGCRVMHLVSNVSFAMKSANAGVDAIVAEGFEAGGHNGPDEMTTMTLIPPIVKAVAIPVVAAGGVSDARGFVAALALGAKGVQMGTRFLATHESAAHAHAKEAVIGLPDNGTCVTGRTTIGPTRAIRNRLTEMIMAEEKKGATPKELFEMIGEGRSLKAFVDGDCDDGTVYCGQIGGNVSELKSAGDVIREIVGEAEALVDSLQNFVKI